MRLAALASLLIVVLSATGCGPKMLKLQTNSYVWIEKGIAVQLPEGAWSAERESGGEMVVFQPDRGPGRLAIQVTPAGPAKGPTPSVLARQLLLAFDEKKVLQTADVQVGSAPPDNRPARASCLLVKATVDKKPVMIRACTLPREGRIYDLICWSTPDDFPAMNRLFEEFLKGVSFPASPPAGAP